MTLVRIIPSLSPRSESKYTSNALAAIQRIRFLPQNICSELPESGLDPRPTVRIPSYGPAGGGTASEKAGFTTQKETARAKEEVGSNVAKSRRLQERSDFRNSFYTRLSKVSSCNDLCEPFSRSSVVDKAVNIPKAR